MPKDTTKDLQDLLREHGLSLRMKDGRMSLEEHAGAGLPRKTRPIYIHIGPKPPGTPGRGEPEGYNLQEKAHMNDDDYTLVYEDTKTVLERTHGIDMRRAITLQNPRAVDLAVQRLVSIHRELEAFARHGYWAPRAFIQMVLRNKSGRANTQARKALVPEALPVGAQPAGAQQAQVPQEGVQQGAEPAAKPPRKRGRPRKVKAPASGGVPTVAAQPVPVVIGQLAPAVIGQPVPAVIGQPVPAVIGQPAPAVIDQPVPAVIGQPIPAVAVQLAPVA
ncbi:hypothetical protein FS749_013141, partial [Ceratobasidium sp. UAMH 11750]